MCEFVGFSCFEKGPEAQKIIQFIQNFYKQISVFSWLILTFKIMKIDGAKIKYLFLNKVAVPSIIFKVFFRLLD